MNKNCFKVAASKETSSSASQSLQSASIVLQQSSLNIQSINTLDPSLSSSSSSPTSIINIVSGGIGGGGGGGGGGISIVGIETTQQLPLQQQTVTVSLNSLQQNQGKAQNSISGRDLPSNSGVMTGL